MTSKTRRIVHNNRPAARVVIWDIDGVLSDDRARAQMHLAAEDQYLEPRSLELRDEPDWDMYYAGLPFDKPFAETVAIFQALHLNQQGVPNQLGTDQYIPVFVTGREDKYRAQTQRWLSDNVHPYAGSSLAPLLMRLAGETKSNGKIKEDIVEYIRQNIGTPVLAFEDNDEAVQNYRDLGIRVMQPSRAVPDGKRYKA